MSSLLERFDAKVNVGPRCWEWSGSRAKAGYGRIIVNGDVILAHRLSYEMSWGPIPEGLFVRHMCDNPPCVRPDHLILGTNLQNMEDARLRGRTRRGADHRQAVLTEDQVKEIRALHTVGLTNKAISGRFGVSAPHVSNIVNRKKWGHLA